MGTGMVFGASLWRSSRWLRRGINRGMSLVSFGLFVAGTAAAIWETSQRYKNSKEKMNDSYRATNFSGELRDLARENESLSREIESLKKCGAEIHGRDRN